jgi:hypothetical protein
MKDGRTAPPSSEPTNQGANLSPGVGALLRGGNGKGAPTDGDSPGASRRNSFWKRSIQISLVLADLVLLGLAARLAIKSGSRLGSTDLIFCVIALVLGAGLTCLAFSWDRLGD